MTTGTNAADDQVNLKADAAGKVYAIIKTGVSDQIKLFDRAPGSPGTWTGHAVWTSANANTRAQVVIDDQHGTAYAFSSTGGTTAGAIYVKAAQLTTLSFPTGRGAAFISSATDHAIDDISLTKQTVTSTTGIVGEAGDRATFWLLHGQLDLPSADTTAPTGTVTINAGAAATAAAAVTLTFAATDVGLGVNQVRFANTNGVDGNGVLNGAGATTISYAATTPWTLAAGDGTKTVYVQFQDAAGNWSTPVSDDIVLDTTGPVGSVTINGGDANAGDNLVTLDVTATDARRRRRQQRPDRERQRGRHQRRPERRLAPSRPPTARPRAGPSRPARTGRETSTSSGRTRSATGRPWPLTTSPSPT